jgi:hypothetical protein
MPVIVYEDKGSHLTSVLPSTVHPKNFIAFLAANPQVRADGVV